MAERKAKVFKVKTKNDGASRFALRGEESGYRLVRAKTDAQVNAHIAQDFEIEVATPEDLHTAGKDGVEIEQAAE